MPFRIGPWELSLILVIVLLIFGAGKLSEVGTAIGKGIRAFRREQRGKEGQEIAAAPRSIQIATKSAKH